MQKAFETCIPRMKLRKQLGSGHARARGIWLLQNRTLFVTSTFVDAFHATATARAKCHEEQECKADEIGHARLQSSEWYRARVV